MSLNQKDDLERTILSDIHISRVERENNIEGIDARVLLEEMRSIVEKS